MSRSSRSAVKTVRALVALALATTTTLSSANAQPPIPVRQLSNVVRSDTTIIMGVASVRHLPNGSVLVNDATKRQLVVFDSSLRHHTISADTTSNSENFYGLRGSTGGLIPYLGDSTLFVDTDSRAFLVLDPSGRIVRVMAPTRANDLYYIGNAQYGNAGFDPKGRLIYRTPRSQDNMMYQNMINAGSTSFTAPDSSSIMRMDLDRRTVDTIGMLKVTPERALATGTGNGLMINTVINPLMTNDEWALLPDGTIAIVRTQDYHVDWLSTDGKLTSGPRMPFDWKRITVEDKQQMIDSIKKADAARVAKLPPPLPGSPPPRPLVIVEAKDIPDFYPPVRQGQVRADYEGNLWILPSTSKDAKEGLSYDVVNRKGEIVERVQLPKGRNLVGFGPRGLVYMHNVISPTRAAIERAMVVRPVTNAQ